jgi:hypothetical protein
MASIATESLSGGLPGELDLAVVVPPDGDSSFGENHAFWLWDDRRRIGLWVHLRTLGHVTSYRQRRETVFVFLPDGTILTSEADGPGPTMPTLARGPNLECECVEPFRSWRVRYDSTAQATTALELRADLLRTEPREALTFDIDVTTTAPPWLLGTYAEGGLSDFASSMVGGRKYEQFIAGSGSIRSRGVVHRIEGTGLRTHRVGRRDTRGLPGHAWLASQFPDGRSFAFKHFGGADRVTQWQEGWVSDGTERHRARVLDAPLFSQRLPGERFTVELESPLGSTSITGELLATNFITQKPPDTQRFCPGIDRSHPRNRAMAQGFARYTWDGSEGTGMVERSLYVGELGPTPPES